MADQDHVEIPTYVELMRPTLAALDQLGGSGSNEQIDAKVIEIAGITEAQLAVMYEKSKKQVLSKVVDRLAWSRTYLKKSELVDNPRRAEWDLLSAGRAVLEMPIDEAEAHLADLDREVRRVENRSKKFLIRRSADPDFTVVYEAAALWRDRSLRDLKSLFEPESTIWTAEASSDLATRFIDGMDEGDRSFSEKLEDQMRDADQDSTRLMAELMFIHLLPLVNITLGTKRRNIDMIGAWARQPFATPVEFEEALELGIFNGGAGFNTRRPNHLRWLIRFAQRWIALSQDDRASLLGDPWDFKAFLYELPLDGAISQRNALLLMLFPDQFEDISSRDHKRRITEAFPSLLGDSADIDRQILAIREAKEHEFGKDFSWYQADVRSIWDDARRKKEPNEPATPLTPASALSSFLANPSDRGAFAMSVASAIEVAHAKNPKSWSLSFRKGGLFLNIGPNRTLGVEPGRLSIALPVAEVDSVGDLGASLAVDEPYSHPGGVALYTTDLQNVGELLDGTRSLLLSAVEQSAARDTSYWKSHSPEALDLVGELSGIELPALASREDAHGQLEQAWIIRVKRDDGQIDSAGSLERSDTRVFWSLDVPPNSTLDVIRDALRAQNPEMGNHSLGNQAGSIFRFITKVQPGDLVLMPDRDDLYIGTIDGPAEYLQDEREWVRPVNWMDDPVDRADVSPALYSRLRSLLTITEISELAGELSSYLTPPGDLEPDTNTSTETRLSPIDDDLAKDWMLDGAWLNEIVTLLQRKRQMIFFGPPGTGKTYLAEKLARHLTSDPSSYKIVQFHPSYSYEDFVEGFRPRADKGALTYELKPGPLRLLADEARKNPGEPYVLIIDEINRGNLAKIFGELYYLLEYREQSLVLQYGSADEDEFSLPENLFVIGTMNTADRSIALVDAAIRRRFNFMEFSPVKEPISVLLSEWLKKEESSDLPARLLDELNRRLDDDDYAIGPSYLMNADALSQSGLERIWKYSIMPLLDEHFFGRQGQTKQFELSALMHAVEPQREPALEEIAPVDEIKADVDADN